MIDQEELPPVLLKIVHAREDFPYCNLLADFLIPLVNQGQLIIYHESEDGRELVKQEKVGKFTQRASQVEDEVNDKIDLFVFLRSNDFTKNKSNCKELILAKARYDEQEPSHIIPVRVGHFMSDDPFLDRFERPDRIPLKSIEQEGALALERAIITIVDGISKLVKIWQKKKARSDKHFLYKEMVKIYADYNKRCMSLEANFPFEEKFARAFGYADEKLNDFELVSEGKDTFVAINDEKLWLKSIRINQTQKVLSATLKRFYKIGAREDVCIGVLFYDIESSQSQTLEEFMRLKEEVKVFYHQVKALASIYEKSGFVMIFPLKVFEREEIIDITGV